MSSTVPEHPADSPLSAAAQATIARAWVAAVSGERADSRSPEDLPARGWEFIERADFDAVVVVRVGQRRIVAAPRSALDAVAGLPGDRLFDAAATAGLLPPGATPIGTADLSFAELIPPPGAAVVRAARADELKALRQEVTASEWEESGVGEADRVWSALAPNGEVAAIGGYTPWSVGLAQMAILAGPRHRGGGYAYAAAAAAVAAALRTGLVAQWRSRQGNAASDRLARQLGFVPFGVQSAVSLGERPSR